MNASNRNTPRDITRRSRREAERRFTDLRWFEELPRGGHFAALEPHQHAGSCRRGVAVKSWWPVAVGVSCSAALAIGVALALRDNPDFTPATLGALIGAVSFLGGVVGWVGRKRWVAVSPATAEETDVAARTLAELVLEQWTAEWRLLSPGRPMPVRWRLTSAMTDRRILDGRHGPVTFSGSSDRIDTLSHSSSRFRRRVGW